MGLTYQSTGKSLTRETFNIKIKNNEPVVALAGNPNTGKSTLFNALTGLRQHTGNWPGKTVLRAEGSLIYNGRRFMLIDLPGTYSLLANSADEEVARDFLCFARPDATVVVVDATCLERNLNLVLQVMEITSRVIVCVNLIDEARRKKLHINIDKLSSALGVPVVATAARSGEGLPQLLNVLTDVVFKRLKPEPKLVRYAPEVEKAIAELEPKVRAMVGDTINARWVALRLIDGDLKLIHAIERYSKSMESPHTPREVLA